MHSKGYSLLHIAFLLAFPLWAVIRASGECEVDMAVSKEQVLDAVDHPFFFVAFGITPFVLGFGALLLWLAEKNNRTGGLARLIRHR
jgi:hypothetical protein